MHKKLSKREIIDVVWGISESIAEDLEYELVDIEYVKEYGDYYLRIYIYRPEGVALDDCQKMSQLLSKQLDKVDPIPGSYYLEVSSPGLDRPLKTDRDLKRNLNKEIEVRLYKAINNQKAYEGILKDFNEKEIIISNHKDEKIIIPKEFISVIRLVIKF